MSVLELPIVREVSRRRRAFPGYDENRSQEAPLQHARTVILGSEHCIENRPAVGNLLVPGGNQDCVVQGKRARDSQVVVLSAVVRRVTNRLEQHADSKYHAVCTLPQAVDLSSVNFRADTHSPCIHGGFAILPAIHSGKTAHRIDELTLLESWAGWASMAI